MNASAPFSRKHLLIAAIAVLTPAASALATADAFDGYNRGIAGRSTATAPAGAQGPAGPALATDMVCGHDPFDAYRRAFNTGGPAQLCGTAKSGAQGPAGPTMASAWSDPFQGYRRGISAE